MRNAEFDREKVLRAAMVAFLQKGYAKTSMQDLKAATGLHPGSIYCAFENKRGLLLAALGQYQQDRSVEFQQLFPTNQPVLTSLKNYLEHVVQECISCDNAKACLLTKALNEIAEQDDEVQAIISKGLGLWQDAFKEQFARAQTNNELPLTRSSDQLARFFVMGIYGLRTFANTHPTADVLHELADQLYHDICA